VPVKVEVRGRRVPSGDGVEGGFDCTKNKAIAQGGDIPPKISINTSNDNIYCFKKSKMCFSAKIIFLSLLIVSLNAQTDNVSFKVGTQSY